MILPVVRRELQMRARSRAVRFARMATAIISVAIAIVTMSMMVATSQPGNVGRGLFATLGWLAFVFCALEGPRVASDAISEEKRNGTLGLLFLTDLSAYDVLLGKLTAASLNSFYSLIAAFPALAFPLLIGGVTAAELGRLVAALMATLIFSLSASIFVSTWSRQVLGSLAGALAVLAFCFFVPPLLKMLTPVGLICFSPWYPFHTSLDSHYRADPVLYWNSLLQVFALSVVFLIAASVCLHRNWRWEGVLVRNSWFMGQLSALGPPRWLLQKNPLEWFSARQVSTAWLCRLMAGLVGLGAVAVANGIPVSGALGRGVLIAIAVVHLVMCLWTGAVAAQLLWKERDSGALELILCTPVRSLEIVEGYYSGLQRVFERPWAFILAIETLLVANIYALSLNGLPWGILVFVLLIGLGTVISEYYALAWFGLWMGLRNRKQLAAVSKTLLWVTIFPLLVMGWCAPLWIAGAIVKNLIFITVARAGLYDDLRKAKPEPLPWSDPAAPPDDSGRLPPILRSS